MTSYTHKRLFEELQVLFKPIFETDGDVQKVLALFESVGWSFTNLLTVAEQQKVADAVGEVVAMRSQLEELAANPPSDLVILVLEITRSIKPVMEGIKNLVQAFPPSIQVPFDELPIDLIEYLTLRYLQAKSATAVPIIELLGVINRKPEQEELLNGKVYRIKNQWPRLELSKLGDVVKSPENVIIEKYWPNGFNDNDEGAGKIAAQVLSIARLGGFMDGMDTSLPGDVDPVDLQDFTQEGRTIIGKEFILDDYSTAMLGLVLEHISTTSGGPGVILTPFGKLSVNQNVGHMLMQIEGNLDGNQLRITPTGIVQVDSSKAPFRAELSLCRDEEVNQVFIFGDNNGTHISLKSYALNLGIELEKNREEVTLGIELKSLVVGVSVGEGDGFIQKILPSNGIETTFDFCFGWSSLDGFYFLGSAALEVTIPIHKSIGPISIETVYIAFNLQDDGDIIIAIAVSAGAAIGPISASVERIGVKTALSFPERGGNLGPLNLEPPSFLPPKGAGLAIDAGAIAGGGYIEFDDENKRYAGILQLQAGVIGLVAIGLITTRMPDGSDGFSLLINIGVEFMPPFQLSYGFTLSGVGGLLGYNRTMNTDVLRDGLRNRTLDSILFPEDPIANAPKIISDLRAVFPPEEGRFVIGPMVKLGWGTPNIIQADIGIFIELPMPIRIALLGQIAAGLPLPEEAIIELHIDVLGIIEFDRQLLSIDATIYDSRIYEYTLTGDAALRLSWGDTPVFAMSLGGFHPRFSPPPNFPTLRRLTLNLSQGSAVQLYCKTYQALTSNSLQFGALVDLYASQSGATVEGNLTFDTLIYFSPFSFVAGMSGNVVARYKGHKLSSVYISLNLSGPTPWNARGKASFEILFWDVDVEFNKIWGPLEAITLEAVDPWPPLKEALEANDSWGSKLPNRNGMVEMLAEIEEEEGASPPLVLHPAGFLEIRQNVLPLGIRLDKLGNAPVKDHNLFEITKIIIGSEELDLLPVEEDFARGQFINLSDPLSTPSFEKMNAGVAASSDRLSFEESWVEPKLLTYESILIQEDRNSKEPKPELKNKATLGWRVAKRQLLGNAARRSGLRTTGRRKFETLGTAKQVGVIKEGYTLVNNADMSKVSISANDGTIGQLQAEQLLSDYLQSNPGMAEQVTIVPSFEVAA